MPPHHRCFIDPPPQPPAARPVVSSAALPPFPPPIDGTAASSLPAADMQAAQMSDRAAAPAAASKGKQRAENQGDAAERSESLSQASHSTVPSFPRVASLDHVGGRGMLESCSDERLQAGIAATHLASPSSDLAGLSRRGGATTSTGRVATRSPSNRETNSKPYPSRSPSPLSSSAHHDLASSSQASPVLFSSTAPLDTRSISQFSEAQLLSTNNTSFHNTRSTASPSFSRPATPPMQLPASTQSSSNRSSRTRSTSTASSHPRSTPRKPSPTPRSRHVNPDRHWLSEDEAALPGGAGRAHRRRQLTRRIVTLESGSEGTGGPDGFTSGDSDGGAWTVKGSVISGMTSTTIRDSHSIHHRPSSLTSPTVTPPPSSPTGRSSPVLPSDQPLHLLAPQLLSALICRSCNRLIREPTSLACGHSVCLPCSLPLPTIASPTAPTTDVPEIGRDLPTLDSLFARNPSVPLSPSSSSNPMDRSPSSNGSLLAGLLSHLGSNAPTSPGRPISRSTSTAAPPRPTCPHASCTGADQAAPVGEPKPDFVLSKVLAIIVRDIPDVAEEVSRHQVGKGDHRRAGQRTNSAGSVATSHSGGGGDDPVGEEENKRVHRMASEWESSKRIRRGSAMNDGSTPEHDTLEAVEDRLISLEGIQLDLTSVPKTFIGELQSELECQVCVQLFYEPITTPCGHTFCKKCLARSLDHSDKCPLCRSDFPSFNYFQQQPVNSTTLSLINLAFPTLAAERVKEAEERSNDLDTAIFVCTLAWPNLPTYIHIFEPRYRLMMRRVMDGDRQFGMVLPSRDGGISEYGTMLYVQSCNMIEDGRSIVETMGSYRFRLLEHGTHDGYTVGRIERVDDISPEQEAELERLALERNPADYDAEAPRGPPEPPTGAPGSGAPPDRQAIEMSTAQLMNVCLEFVQTLRTGSAPWVLQRLNNTIGPMPSQPSDFSFWMAEVMPVDDHVKAALLQITSPRERLRLLVFWIEQFRSSWWFSRGCSIM